MLVRRKFPRAKVIHRHRVGTLTFSRVSELCFVAGKPTVILRWIDVGGLRTPVYSCELNAAKLHKAGQDLFYYDEVTVDPRYVELNAAVSEHCRISEDGEVLHAEIRTYAMSAVLESYRNILSDALRKGVDRVLVVCKADCDPVTRYDLTNVLKIVASRRSGFQLALVANTPPKLRAYKEIEAQAQAMGISVKIFHEENAAARWLRAPRPD